ncbi:MAG TPA: S-adenosylmethionine synthetase N-terminal domain-containing protein [Desulfomonilaceae bacterium]|nr:S-adenosylmethionine synthetase N-terminal domain-containing protein [Desulfomonilaceae bacterium]
MNKDFINMSESVTERHPDKLCDRRIGDAIIDRLPAHDAMDRNTAECEVSWTRLLNKNIT